MGIDDLLQPRKRSGLAAVVAALAETEPAGPIESRPGRADEPNHPFDDLVHHHVAIIRGRRYIERLTVFALGPTAPQSVRRRKPRRIRLGPLLVPHLRSLRSGRLLVDGCSPGTDVTRLGSSGCRPSFLGCPD